MQRLKKLRLLFLGLILPLISNCAVSTTAIPTVSDFCQIAKPMTFSGKGDTQETQKEILDFDERYACVCQDRCPKAPSK